MSYVTRIERDVMLKVIEKQLRTKFGAEGAASAPTIWTMNDAEKYLIISDAILLATTLEEVRQACAEAAAPPSRRKRKKITNGGTSPA
jgi:hypothetical protein